MYSSLDTVWVLLCTALIFFMQAGFAMLETGFTRAKNAGNIIMKNLMDYCIGSVLFWVIGFSFLYGDSIGGFIGTPSLFAAGKFAAAGDLPKIKVEIVISTVPLGLLIDTIRKVLYTGKIGDGKIFVYDVANVVKIRTGAEDEQALE